MTSRLPCTDPSYCDAKHLRYNSVNSLPFLFPERAPETGSVASGRGEPTMPRFGQLHYGMVDPKWQVAELRNEMKGKTFLGARPFVVRRPSSAATSTSRPKICYV